MKKLHLLLILGGLASHSFATIGDTPYTVSQRLGVVNGDSFDKLPSGVKEYANTVVRITEYNANDKGEYQCTGVILDDQRILTAEHCLIDSTGQKRVFSKLVIMNPQNKTITLNSENNSYTVFTPPAFHSFHSGTDLAIIKANNSGEFSSMIGANGKTLQFDTALNTLITDLFGKNSYTLLLSQNNGFGFGSYPTWDNEPIGHSFVTFASVEPSIATLNYNELNNPNKIVMFSDGWYQPYDYQVIKSTSSNGTVDGRLSNTNLALRIYPSSSTMQQPSQGGDSGGPIIACNDVKCTTPKLIGIHTAGADNVQAFTTLANPYFHDIFQRSYF